MSRVHMFLCVISVSTLKGLHTFQTETFSWALHPETQLYIRVHLLLKHREARSPSK
jgi:hypothetical protein